jgi:2-polyprenyl-3-methyl-5-hydroxy-6-metoxy-1,4-benzoquinol methylase
MAMPCWYFAGGKKGAMILPGSKIDFDKAASFWDDEPRRIKLANDVAKAIRREVKLLQDMEVLDYGCGTGLITLHLQPCVHSITGADTSQGMLESLRQKVRERCLTNVSTVLIDPAMEILNVGKYHLVVSSMTLHHIQDVEGLFKEFYRVLLPEGQLCLADLDVEDGSFHGDSGVVPHFGFDRQQLRNMLVCAGFKDIRDLTATTIVKGADETQRRAYPVFLLIAGKSVAAR